MPLALFLADNVLLSTHPVDANESLVHFQWWGYIVVAILYSAFVFFAGFLDRASRFIESERNPTGPVSWLGYSSIPRFRTNKRPSQILAIHCTYLLGLMCCIRIAAFSVPYFPTWSTSQFDIGRGDQFSVLDLSLVLVGLVLAMVERSKLCAEADDSEV